MSSGDLAVSKWVLAKRIPDRVVLDAIRAVAARPGAKLVMLEDPLAQPAIALADLLRELDHLDAGAVRVRCSSMLINGVLAGCACGLLGQCCKVAIRNEKDPPSRKAKRVRREP